METGFTKVLSFIDSEATPFRVYTVSTILSVSEDFFNSVCFYTIEEEKERNFAVSGIFLKNLLARAKHSLMSLNSLVPAKDRSSAQAMEKNVRKL